MSAHSKTPVESIFLESGCVTLKYKIMSRRLNFLHYILNRPENDLVRKNFEVQSKYPVKGDWINTVKSDLEKLKINMNMEDIRNETKENFKEMVKIKVKEATLEELLK